MIASIWGKGDWTDREALQNSFIDHNVSVRAIVPPDRFLEFNPKQGSEPLCTFLDADVPVDMEFPHANEGETAALVHYPLY